MKCKRVFELVDLIEQEINIDSIKNLEDNQLSLQDKFEDELLENHLNEPLKITLEEEKYLIKNGIIRYLSDSEKDILKEANITESLEGGDLNNKYKTLHNQIESATVQRNNLKNKSHELCGRISKLDSKLFTNLESDVVSVGHFIWHFLVTSKERREREKKKLTELKEEDKDSDKKIREIVSQRMEIIKTYDILKKVAFTENGSLVSPGNLLSYEKIHELCRDSLFRKSEVNFDLYLISPDIVPAAEKYGEDVAKQAYKSVLKELKEREIPKGGINIVENLTDVLLKISSFISKEKKFELSYMPKTDTRTIECEPCFGTGYTYSAAENGLYFTCDSCNGEGEWKSEYTASIKLKIIPS